MENELLESEDVKKLSDFYALSYEQWQKGSIDEFDLTFKALDKLLSFEIFRFELIKKTNNIISSIAKENIFDEKEFFITNFENRILITNKRLYISKSGNITKEFDSYLIGRIASINFSHINNSVTIKLMNKQIVYINYDDYNLQEIINRVKNSFVYKSFNPGFERKYNSNIKNLKKNQKKETAFQSILSILLANIARYIYYSFGMAVLLIIVSIIFLDRPMGSAIVDALKTFPIIVVITTILVIMKDFGDED